MQPQSSLKGWRPDSAGRDMRVHQQVWVLDGRIEITIGDSTHALATGDCLAFELDQPTSYRNPHRKAARYAVAITTERPFK